MATLTEMHELMEEAIKDRKGGVINDLVNKDVNADRSLTIEIPLSAGQNRIFTLTPDQVESVRLTPIKDAFKAVHEQIDLWVLGAAVGALSCSAGYYRPPWVQMTTTWDPGSEVSSALAIGVTFKDPLTRAGVLTTLKGLLVVFEKKLEANPGNAELQKQVTVLRQIVTQV